MYYMLNILQGLSFDWGGFLGGVIGTIGAFLVALYTFNTQKKLQKPTKNKRGFIIANSLSSLLEQMSWNLLLNEKMNVDLMLTTLDYIKEINELIPDAVEAGDKKLLATIEMSINKIKEINQKYKKVIHEGDNMTDYISDMCDLVETSKKECNSIINKFKDK